MKILVRILCVFLCMSSVLFSEFTVHNYSSSIVKGPYFYNSYLYYIDDDNQLIKSNTSGVQVWKIQLDGAETKQLNISFDSIFVVNDTGSLTAYDADYGYRIWGPNQLKLKEVVFNYPVAVILTTQGNLKGIDFFSGQEIWSKPSFNWTHLLFEVSNGLFYVSNENGISVRDVNTGQQSNFNRYSQKLTFHEGSAFVSFLSSSYQTNYSSFQNSSLSTTLSSKFRFSGALNDKSLFLNEIDSQLIVKTSSTFETLIEFPLPLNSISSFVEPFADYVSIVYEGGVKILGVNDSAENVFSHHSLSKDDFIKAIRIDQSFYFFFKDKYLVWQDN